MALTVNTNIASLSAQNNLSKSQETLATSMKRLSSGLRINSAKDDDAGFVIATRMSCQIRGLNQAARNANDGISLAQTAEGALNEHTNILQRIRELAVQSANSTNTSEDRASLQAEVNQLQSELERIATKTAFNGLNILDGTFTNQKFQVGADANDTISVSIASVKNDDLGRYYYVAENDDNQQGTGSTIAAAATAIGADNSIAGQTVSLIGCTTETVAVAAGDTAQTIAKTINGVSASTGISATATTTATLGTLSAVGTVSLSIGSSGTVYSIGNVAISDTNDISGIATAINNQFGKTGVTASYESSTNTITLTQSDGKDIVIEGFTNTGAGTLVFTGSKEGAGVSLTDGGNDSSRASGEVELYSTSAFSATSNVADAAGSIFNVAADTVGATTQETVSAIDISTAAGAATAITIVDAALTTVNSTRGDLGAVQGRFESTIANIINVSENLTAARSRIMDADIAMETAAMTKSNILQLAGVAILAQANQMPSLDLSLLK